LILVTSVRHRCEITDFRLTHKVKYNLRYNSITSGLNKRKELPNNAENKERALQNLNFAKLSTIKFIELQR